MINDNGKRIKGVLSPVVTPFDKNFYPDTKRLISHCQWLLNNDVGLALFGTNSEANSLSVDEKIELLEKVIDSGLPAERMMPGTGCCAITDSIRLTKRATELGCGGVLMLPPFYYKDVSDEGLYRNYAEIIDKVGDAQLRIYLYHIPPVAQVSISLPLIEKLLKNFPTTIAGVKDSSGDWNNTNTMLQQFQPEGFDVFPGSETYLLAALRGGGAGCISATANVNPAAIARLAQTWQQNDADNQQKKLDDTRNVFQSYVMIPALKAAIANFGSDPVWNRLRPPLVELTSKEQKSLLDKLYALSFDMPGLT